MGGAAHLLDARPAVRPRRVAVQVAADVAELDERRRLAAERRLAQLRRAPGDAERARRPRCSSGASGSGSSAATYAGEPGGAQERGAEALRLGGDELDRHALDGHAHAPAARSARPRATIWGSAAKRAEHAARIGAAHTTASRSHASRQRRTSPAASPPSAAAIPPTSSRALVEQQPAPRPRLGLAGERLEQLRLDLRPDPGDRPQPARGGGLAQLVGACGRRAPARAPPTASRSSPR